ASHLDTAALADDPLEADALVLAAVALPVASRSEDLLAEQAVLLRLQCAVVDGLRLLDLAEGPVADVVRGGKTDAEFIEEVDVYTVPPCPLSGLEKLTSARGGAADQARSSTDADSLRDRLIPRFAAARSRSSSSPSRISIAAPSEDSTSTFRHNDCSSLS